VVHSNLVHPGREAVDSEPAEGIGLEHRRAALHYDVGAGQESTVQAVDDQTYDVRLAGRGVVGLARARLVLGDDRRRKNDRRRCDEYFQSA
jgi:hypothetical protein